jgi:hypothetical protein
MKASELVGQKALRTKPVDLKNGHQDYSYCGGTGTKILKVTDSHIYVEGHCGPWVLDNRWLDDNWTDYIELVQP